MNTTPTSWELWKAIYYFQSNNIPTLPDFWFWVGVAWSGSRTKEEFIHNLDKYLLLNTEEYGEATLLMLKYIESLEGKKYEKNT